MLPALTDDGVLPVGIHLATWVEFEERFVTNTRRRALFLGFCKAADLLAAAGCRKVFIDGSYTTSKPEPNDIDACWSIVGVDADILDPVFFDFADGRRAQKERFGCEFFPAEISEGSTGLLWIEFFSLDRDGRKKGLVALELGGKRR